MSVFKLFRHNSDPILTYGQILPPFDFACLVTTFHFYFVIEDSAQDALSGPVDERVELPQRTVSYVDYADDVALLRNTRAIDRLAIQVF